MAEENNDPGMIENPEDNKEFLEYLQQQVSGIPSSNIPKHRRLNPESYKEGVLAFLKENPDLFGTQKK